MMRIVSSLAVAAVLAAAPPTLAQEAPSAAQLALAERYLELSQSTAMNETIAREMEQSLGKAELSAEQRDWLTRNMTSTLVDIIESSFAELADDVALLFTEEELRAAIAFHETPVGRSFNDKSMELGIRIEQTMGPRVIQGLTALAEKYCARFDCEAEQGASRGKAKN